MLKNRIGGLICLATLLQAVMMPVALGASETVVRLNNDGVNLMKANNFQLAAQKFQTALGLDPDYLLAKQNLSIDFNNWGISVSASPEDAMSKFENSLYFAPDNPTSRKNLDTSIKRLGLNPESFDDRKKLGEKAVLRKDYRAAKVEFREALRIKDDSELREKLAKLPEPTLSATPTNIAKCVRRKQERRPFKIHGFGSK